MKKTQIKQLIEEFEAVVGLSPTESRRSVFIALATARGWNNARIARYLGVHRQRIGQKLEKYQAYVEFGDMPRLAKVLDYGTVFPDTAPGVVAFTQADWENEEFAMGMLDLVASLEPVTQAA